MVWRSSASSAFFFFFLFKSSSNNRKSQPKLKTLHKYLWQENDKE